LRAFAYYQILSLNEKRQYEIKLIKLNKQMKKLPKHMRKTIIDLPLRKKLIALINETFKIDITADTRKQEYVFGRMIYFKILRDLGYGFQPIGRTLNKDHSTVIHSVRTFDDLVIYDKELYRTYNIIKELVIKSIDTVDIEKATYSELVRCLRNLERENVSLRQEIQLLKKTKFISIKN
jgi:hypothetical protein